MTRKEFAQELLLRHLVMQGKPLNKSEMAPSEKTDIARMATFATSLAEAAPDGFFDNDDLDQN
jgi:hypothetical protein